MKIILVRHGEVQEKYHNKYNGHIDIKLSQKGKTQAKLLAREFENEEFDYIFCSDLKRAKETLFPFKQSLNAAYTDKLREKSWGKHEGLSFDEIIALGDLQYTEFQKWISELDGEPYEAYIQRIKEFFLTYLTSLNAGSILVVTHGGVIRVLIALVNKLSLEEAFSVSVPYSGYIIYDTNSQTFSEVKTSLS